jgi:hypothetical protein
MWNVTEHQLRELLYLELEGSRFVPGLVTTYHVTWGTSVDLSVLIILAVYVLWLQFKKKAVDNFRVEQGP